MAVIETLKRRIKLWGRPAAGWAASDDVLLEDEPAYDRTNGALKIGDGVTPFSGLPAFLDETALNDAYAAVDVTPTLEELSTSFLLTSGDITAETVLPVRAALFRETLDRVSMAFTADVPASETDYWTVTFQRKRTLLSNIVSKTTRSTDLHGDGEPVTALRAWDFDGLAFSDYATLDAGDVLLVRFTPTGAPPPLSAPMLTLRAVPSDVASLPDGVTDTFTRPDDSTSLGVSDTGHEWEAHNGTWGVASNQATLITPGPAQSVVTVDAGASDCTVEHKLVSRTGSSFGLALRVTNSANFGFLLNQLQCYKYESATATNLGANFAQQLENGDSVRAVLSGDTVTIYRDAGTTGTWVQIGQYSTTFNQTATKMGLRAASVSTAPIFDDFEVYPNA